MDNKQISAIAHELKFWKGFVQTPRFLVGWVNNVKTPELNEDVYNFILQNTTKEDLILDVGSGVVSILHGIGRLVVPVDPLGELYEVIFDYQKHRIAPPVGLSAEELASENEYKIVHISNAIDHSQEPTVAFEKLFRAVVPGGYLIIQGFENEAIYENYQGFHQYNFALNDANVLVVSDKTKEIGCFADDDNHKTVLAKKIIFENNKSWFIWIVQKV